MEERDSENSRGRVVIDLPNVLQAEMEERESENSTGNMHSTEVVTYRTFCRRRWKKEIVRTAQETRTEVVTYRMFCRRRWKKEIVTTAEEEW